MHLLWIIIGIILACALTFLIVGKIIKLFISNKYHSRIDNAVRNSILFVGKAFLYLIVLSINLGIMALVFNFFSLIYSSLYGKNWFLSSPPCVRRCRRIGDGWGETWIQIRKRIPLTRPASQATICHKGRGQAHRILIKHLHSTPHCINLSSLLCILRVEHVGGFAFWCGVWLSCP